MLLRPPSPGTPPDSHTAGPVTCRRAVLAVVLPVVLPVVLAVLVGASSVLLSPAALAARTEPPLLGSDLSYHRVGWHGTAADPDGDFAGVSVSAPRAWRFVLTPDRQGRFSDPTHTWLLTVQWPDETAGVRAEVADRVAALTGTRDLQILARRVVATADRTAVVGTLTYRYTDPAGTPRWVSYHYDGFSDGFATDVVSVAGRPGDAPGLRSVLRHATRSVALAG